MDYALNCQLSVQKFRQLSADTRLPKAKPHGWSVLVILLSFHELPRDKPHLIDCDQQSDSYRCVPPKFAPLASILLTEALEHIKTFVNLPYSFESIVHLNRSG
jgi:hypothetical protein